MSFQEDFMAIQYTLTAKFTDPVQASRARKAILENGFSRRDLSVLSKTIHGEQVDSNLLQNTVNGFVSGFTAGGVIGALVGFLIGQGITTFTGVNWFLVAVPLMHAIGIFGVSATVLSGALLGGIAGGLIGALMGISIPDNEVFTYKEPIKAGESILALKIPDYRIHEVRSLLQDYAPYQIQTRQENSSRSKTFYSPYTITGLKGGKSQKSKISN